jgi:RHS repeat-associated protein
VARSYWDADLSLLRSIHQEYDGAGRVRSLRDGLTPLVEWDRAGGRVAQIRYGNGLVRSYRYGPEGGPLEAVDTRDAQGASVESSSFVYGFDAETISVEVTTTTAGGVAATTSERYEMSPQMVDGVRSHRHRVTGFHGEGPGGAFDLDLVYDGRSNLLAEGNALLHYNAESNRLLQIEFGNGETLDYAYDTAGFTTRRGGRDITWQANGRIASHGFDRFAWDVLGRPIESTVDGVTTRAAWGGAVSSDATGSPLLLDLDDVAIDLQDGRHLYRHLDFRSNVKFTSDDGGAVQAHYAYSPYRVEQVLGDDSDPVRFVGRSQVGELAILGARIYDPQAGRFLSPDPIFQAVNQYGYTLGNPVLFHDRMGTSPEGQAGNAPDAAGGSVGEAMVQVGNAALITAAILALVGHHVLAAAFALFGGLLVWVGSSIGGCRSPRRREEWIAGRA